MATDPFEFKSKSYLITVDYYSNFWEVDKLPNTKANTIILKLKNHFARYGCPDTMISDNGPQFACKEGKNFAQTWELEHRTISPSNSQANGKVESAVKTAKRLLRKAFKAGTDPYLAILHYRNTPTQGVGSSPAQRLMSCRTKTLLPATNQLLRPQASSTAEQRTKLVERQIKQKLYYDRHAKDLQPLSKGHVVRVKPFRPGEKDWRKVVVIGQPDKRSYTVETSDGGVYRRNRVHLKRTKQQPPMVQLDNEPAHSTNPASSKPTDHTKTPSPPRMDESSKVKSSQSDVKVNSTPLKMALRPARVRRPPERLKDYVCY